MATKENIFQKAGHKLYEWTHPEKKRVFFFHEGGINDKNLLGNKGANLCEMDRMKLPVPPGFIITTESCLEYLYGEPGLEKDGLSSHLIEQYMQGVQTLEKQTGKFFSTANDDTSSDLPLLLSVRSGSAVSMPGMMDTVLNLGINKQRVERMATVTKNSRWAWDTYRRFIQMFGNVVLGVDKDRYETVLRDVRSKAHVEYDSALSTSELQTVVRRFLEIAPVPEDPWQQLLMAIRAVFQSWNNPRAIKYRDIHGLAQNLGTGVTIQTMVYGNVNTKSGSGVGFTRNPATGESEFYGEYLVNAEGEDVVAGIRTPMTLLELKADLPAVYDELKDIACKLEMHYKDVQDLEFTVENGQLFILQTRTAKRTAHAAVRIAVSLVDEKLITEREALMRIEASQMDFFMHPMVDPACLTSRPVIEKIVGRGLAASAGCAVGHLIFSNEAAEQYLEQGQKDTILCRFETSADDIAGMNAAGGCLTINGGLTSHAAVVMRGMGKPAVTGARNMQINAEKKQLVGEDMYGALIIIKEGDVITVDGTSGLIFLGEIPTIHSGQDEYFQTILRWSDKYRRLKVLCNADKLSDAERGIMLGAEGIGLIRTEHMFFHPERLPIFRKFILAADAVERYAYLKELGPFQKLDFLKLLRVCDKKPVTIRLLDPPLHEFLPDVNLGRDELAEVAMEMGIDMEQAILRVKTLRESNPMLGFRGCRLYIMFPEIAEMQVRAIISAAIIAVNEGIEVAPEIMLPLVTTDHEIDMLVPVIRDTYESTIRDFDWELHGKITSTTDNLKAAIPLKIGSMLETPRACLRANRIATCNGLNFVSIGSNDLTQLIFALSRDDTQRFMPSYVQNHLVSQDPFQTIDISGVGAMIEMAVEKCYRANPNLKIGLCGEHGGDPKSVKWIDSLKHISYVSCAASRLPAVKIAAAQAHIEEMQRQATRSAMLPLFGKGIPMIL